MTTLIFIFLLAIGASLIQRVSGFGFGIFVMMFFPYFIPSYGEATTLSGLLAGSTALIIAIRNFRYIQWGIMLPLLVVNVIASYIAIEYMASLSSVALKRCFGAMFVLIAIYFLFFEKKDRRLPRNWWTKGVLGTLSGVMGGMFAMPGPPIVLYCISNINGKLAYIATLQAFSFMLNIFYTGFRAKVGFFGENTLLWWVVGLLGALIGTTIGTRLFGIISSEILKKVVYILLFISGVVAMI
ncbi:MAG: sulfite exporter TauE/SafE family protein [Bacteroidaceae bacterium]|nr:sulfite exporter TauE/SafE family protein [Bacteroidaceae bacterium]